MPELITHGVTGYIANTTTHLAKAAVDIDRIDRWTCRRASEDRFSMARMAQDHELLFRRVIRNWPQLTPCLKLRQFTLLSTSEYSPPDVACSDGLAGMAYHEAPAAVRDYAALFEHLVEVALGPEETAAVITKHREANR